MNKKSEIHELIKNTKENEIKSVELNIFQVFGSNNIFCVKEFQRKYEWAKLQIEELIFEIDKHVKNQSYFLGMIIFKREAISDNEIKLNIVDGQQRITTLFLLLKALEKKISSFNLSDYYEKIVFDKKILDIIKNTYSINFKKGAKPRLKITHLRGENELKNILIDNYSLEEEELENSLFVPALETMENNFRNKSFEELIEFYNKIKKIKFSIVILGKKINEYKVFEDLNSKGVDLKIDDLIRNFFAQKAIDFDSSNTTSYVDSYEQLLYSVEIFLKNEKKYNRGFFSDQIGRWFKNYIIYKLDGKKTVSDTNDKRMYLLYKDEVKNKITKNTDLSNEILNIKSYLEFCKWMNGETNDLYLSNDIEIYPVFFEFYKNANKSHYKLENLEKILVNIYVTIICGSKSIKDFNKKYLEVIKKIFFEGDIKEQIFEETCSNILEKIEFTKSNIKDTIVKKIVEDSVILKEPKMKRFIPYFFSKMIENKTKQKIQLYKNEYNIEHIIPQLPDFSKIEDENERLKQINLLFLNVDRLKNLALIEKSLNIELGNKFYDEKKVKFQKLAKDNIYLETTSEIFQYKKFEEAELEERFESIKEFSVKFAEDLIFFK